MRSLIIASLFLTLLSAAALRGDDTAIRGIGGAIQPMKEHPTVVMERMEVDIDLYRTYARVDCRFAFHNTGAATFVRMGFPEIAFYQPRRRHPVGFARFATWIDGKRVWASIEGLKWVKPENHWTRWRVKRVSFAPGQTRITRVCYQAPLGEGGEPGRWFQYVVHTGGSWKGAIGYARVLLHAHYDPARQWLDVPQRFCRIGETTFEWVARQFEPGSAADDIDVTYYDKFVGVEVLTATNADYDVLGSRPGLMIERGAILGEARLLADWLRGELIWQMPTAILIKGGHTAKLRLDSRWLIADGRRVTLPVAPRLQSGALVVPLAPVARALGAEVGFEPQHRVLRVALPSFRVLSEQLGRTAAQAVFDALPLGYDLPAVADYAEVIRSTSGSVTGGQPGICTGDFFADGRRSSALILRKGSRIGVAALHPDSDGSVYSFQWLPGFPGKGGSDNGRICIGLKTRAPGVVAYWQEREATPKSGRLSLAHDGIERIWGEKAATLFYWDKPQKRFAHVQTAD